MHIDDGTKTNNIIIYNQLLFITRRLLSMWIIHVAGNAFEHANFVCLLLPIYYVYL